MGGHDDRREQDCTVIILAGGQGVRMRGLGRLSPKAALVAYDRPLLVRLLDQARAAGFGRLIVSTSPAHHPTLDELIATYRETRMRDEGSPLAEVTVLENAAHALGPLEALGAALDSVTTEDCLLALGDTFFLDNPFPAFRKVAGRDADWMGVAPITHPRELASGGLVICDGANIVDVRERPGPPPPYARRWTGMARFRHGLSDDLRRLLAQMPPGSPEGDLFAYRIGLGEPVRALCGPDFVNVNAPEQVLLASLYAAMESPDLPSTAGDAVSQAAAALRQSLLEDAAT